MIQKNDLLVKPRLHRGLKGFKHTKDIYKVVPPLAVDPKTGEILNKTIYNKFVKIKDGRDFYQEIQSYKDECDIYQILERVKNGEIALMNAKPGTYGDVSNLPDNFIDLMKWMDKNQEILKTLDKETIEKVSKANISKDELDSVVADMVKRELVRRGYNIEDSAPASSSTNDGGDK